MNNLKDLALECKQYKELIPRLYDDLAAVKKAHKDAVEFNYDLAEENTTIHTKVLAMQERIAALETEREGVRLAFGIGEKAFNQSVLLVCIGNVIRRSECLNRIENYLTKNEIDEDGEVQEVSLLNWGDEPDAYITRFRKVISAPPQEAMGNE